METVSLSIFLIIWLVLYFLLKKVCKSHVHPVLVFFILSFCYVFFTPFIGLISGGDYFREKGWFIDPNVYDEVFFTSIFFFIGMSTVALLFKFLNKEFKSVSSEVVSFNSKKLNIVVVVLMLITIYLLWLRYFSVAGIQGFLLYSTRRDFFHDVENNSFGIFRHNYFFYIALSFFYLSIWLKIKSKLKVVDASFKIIILLILIYSSLLLFVGNRLILVSAVIGLFSINYIWDKNLFKIKRRSKRILTVLGLVLIVSFSYFGEIRNELRSSLFNENRSLSLSQSLSFVHIIPSEFNSLYLGHSSLSYIENESLEHNVFVSLFPNTLLKFWGYEKTMLSQKVVDKSVYSSGKAVYTFPLVAEGKFSFAPSIVSYFIGFSVCLLLYITIIIGNRKNDCVLFFVMAPVYTFNIWYYVRNEVSTSFGFYWQSILVSLLFFIVLRKLIKVKLVKV